MLLIIENTVFKRKFKATLISKLNEIIGFKLYI